MASIRDTLASLFAKEIPSAIQGTPLGKAYPNVAQPEPGLEAPFLSPDDFIGTGIGKATLAGGAKLAPLLMGMVKPQNEMKPLVKALESKLIADESGKPLTLYHGGPKFEGQFKIPEGSDKGIYFTDNPYFAQDQFALQHELSMRDKTGFGYKDVPEHMLESGEWDPKYFKFAEVKKVNLNANNPKIIEALDAKAIPNVYSPEHDAVIVKSTGDFGYKGGQYVVFDPNKINILK